MKNEKFLRLLSGIDEKLIEKAGEDLENYHKSATTYTVSSNSRKKTWKRITAAVCAAAAMAGVVFFMKNVGDIHVAESSGVVLSEGNASLPELPIISKPGNTPSDTKERSHRFYFDFTDSDREQFDNGGNKINDWSEPAVVYCRAGDLTNISSSRPVELAVWDSNDIDYGYRLTPYVYATRTNYEYSLPYDQVMSRIVYLYGFGDSGTKVSGSWTP